MQQYTLQPVTTVAKVHSVSCQATLIFSLAFPQIPHTMSFEEAATIPDNFVTAYLTAFTRLGLSAPDSFPAVAPPNDVTTPILIYGGGSTAGQYTIQLLGAAGYKNILVTASPKHHQFLKSLGAAHTFDYKSESLVNDIASAIGGERKVKYAVDCISAQTTLVHLAQVVAPDAKVAILLPIKEGDTLYNGKGAQMYLELEAPEHLFQFEKTVELLGIAAFRYQDASVSLCCASIVKGSNSVILVFIPQGEVTPKNPS
jgi:NADPH:quinone reductase-like Zn-dependent oxidoreductase